MTQILLDTGPLVALLDAGDQDHPRCVAAAQRLRGELVTTWPVVTEAMDLLSGALGAPDRVLELLETGAVRLAPLDASDVPALRRLMRRYASLPTDVADASVVRVAERDGIFDVFTLDRHFRVYRIARGQAFAIIP